MKNLLPTIITLMIVAIASCKKDDSPFDKSVIGTWNVVSDSTYSSGIGPNGPPSYYKYTGVAGDHFIFTGNKLYVKEGTAKIDTATYSISKDTMKLNYSYLYEGGVLISGAAGSYIITQINSTQLELTSSVLSPGGVFREFIILSR